MATEGEIITIKEHSKKKYSILKKYMKVCAGFAEKYKNFTYIDTHGGSGKIFLPDGKTLDSGSTLIVQDAKSGYPFYVTEINNDRYNNLKKFTESYKNILLNISEASYNSYPFQYEEKYLLENNVSHFSKNKDKKHEYILKCY